MAGDPDAGAHQQEQGDVTPDPMTACGLQRSSLVARLLGSRCPTSTLALCTFYPGSYRFKPERATFSWRPAR